jgi:hypothetical protein
MFECVILMAISVAAGAREASAAPPTLVPAGVPLRVALESRVGIHRVGQPIRGRTVDPVYVFDRLALPAGTIVEGHVAKIGGVPLSRRLTAILSGNLTPPREVRAQFDTVVLGDGSRLPLHTSPSRGTAHTARIAKRTKKGESALRGARERLGEIDRTAVLAFKSPGPMSQLKSTLFGMFPYHRQAWQAGTLFDSVLQDPLVGLPQGRLEPQTGDPAAAAPAREVCTRLLTPVSSRTARRGTPVVAVVTRPVFAADRTLLVPEGSRLSGDVVKVQPARFFHRNGRVFFVFRRIELKAGASQAIRGYVEGVEANFDAHLALDSEGAARVASSKTRFIFPAVAAAVAGLSIHQDYNAHGVPDQDIGGRAESGAVGLGLIGTALAQASRTLASSIAFAGAGFSVYSTFIARGADVLLPVNTPVKIGFALRVGESGGGQRMK